MLSNKDLVRATRRRGSVSECRHILRWVLEARCSAREGLDARPSRDFERLMIAVHAREIWFRVECACAGPCFLMLSKTQKLGRAVFSNTTSSVQVFAANFHWWRNMYCVKSEESSGYDGLVRDVFNPCSCSRKLPYRDAIQQHSFDNCSSTSTHVGLNKNGQFGEA